VPLAKAVGKDVFLFFSKKILCREPGAKAVGKDNFLFFKKKIVCREPSATTLGKAGNTRAGKIFPKVAERNCQKPSAKTPLPTAPLGKETTFWFYFIFSYMYVCVFIYIHIGHGYSSRCVVNNIQRPAVLVAVAPVT
jgi:hypothetical protein